MRSNIVIKKFENDDGYLINTNPEYVLKKIFNVSGNVKVEKNEKDNLFYVDDNLICSFRINYCEELYDYVIDIVTENYCYKFCCDETMEGVVIKLNEYFFNDNGKNIRILNYGYGVATDITMNNKGLAIEIEDKDINKSMFEKIIKSLKFEDSLEKIYDRLSVLSLNDNIKIKKYTKLNTCDYREEVTDLLVIRDGYLEEFLTSVRVNIDEVDACYTIKKDINGYNVCMKNSSICGLSNMYFAMNNQIKFIEKLEKKSKIINRVRKK